MLTFSPETTARIIAFYTWINRPSVIALFIASATAFGIGFFWLGWKWTALSFFISAVVDVVRLLNKLNRRRGLR